MHLGCASSPFINSRTPPTVASTREAVHRENAVAADLCRHPATVCRKRAFRTTLDVVRRRKNSAPPRLSRHCGDVGTPVAVSLRVSTSGDWQ
jgi:hypothetical protein